MPFSFIKENKNNKKKMIVNAFISLYYIIAIMATVSIITADDGLAITYYCLTGVYLMMAVGFEMMEWSKMKAQPISKLHECVWLMHITVFICILYGNFSGYESMKSFFKHSAGSHPFMFLVNTGMLMLNTRNLSNSPFLIRLIIGYVVIMWLLLVFLLFRAVK